MITNDARCTREIKSMIVTAKFAFNKKRTLANHTGLQFKGETSKVLHLEQSFVWCGNLDTSESRSGIPGKFRSLVLEKDGDQLDRSCDK